MEEDKEVTHEEQVDNYSNEQCKRVDYITLGESHDFWRNGDDDIYDALYGREENEHEDE